MAGRVCPWWLGYFLDNPLRRLYQKPENILGPYVNEGRTCLDLGCGMGFFTRPLAGLVGPLGQVVAVDLQPKMLEGLKRKAAKHGLDHRIEPRLCRADMLGIDDLAGQVDFALAFAVVHEVPDASGFFAQIRRALKPGARLLLAEPSGHVSIEAFEKTMQTAKEAGLDLVGRPKIRMSRAALFEKS